MTKITVVKRKVLNHKCIGSKKKENTYNARSFGKLMIKKELEKNLNAEKTITKQKTNPNTTQKKNQTFFPR